MRTDAQTETLDGTAGLVGPLPTGRDLDEHGHGEWIARQGEQHPRPGGPPAPNGRGERIARATSPNTRRTYAPATAAMAVTAVRRAARDAGQQLRVSSVDGGASITWLPSFEYDGVHWNSTVLSHAFYLAIEGGRNKTTGRTVEGIGGANRADIERIFFRAMTDLMPPESSFKLAADAILQSAADLTGVGSAAYRAVDQALRAGGL